ncbi:hypothetical protein PV08_06129 [Exophiala spinifera]|uniref:Cyclase n=1 Tax=Exophiala spinifera TaxID=91928 RepID=A0A0D2BAU3_9EURO|nr:uncharacterized protein PV08_06129 [Exophiala spinifera]KIW16078.1 hypothetical protein PV08_06129 [Exophiala spinifera]
MKSHSHHVDGDGNHHKGDGAGNDESAVEIHPMHLLPFDSLPNKKQVWPCRPGSRGEGLGRLVLLTPDVVAAAAARCIRTGRRVSLGWELTKLEIANFGRSPCDHRIVPLLDGVAFDDIYTFNPQQSSQWDGLRHFSQPVVVVTPPGSGSGSAEETGLEEKEDRVLKEDAEGDGEVEVEVKVEDKGKKSTGSKRLFYGGVTPSEIISTASDRIGIQHWAKQGICGRGVLLDYVRYAERRGITYSTFSDHAIPLSAMLEMAAEQDNLTFRRGDILFVRVGVTREWDTVMTRGDKIAYANSPNPQHAGVEGTEEMARWIWDQGFAAVASDAISFEVYPPKESHVRRCCRPPGEDEAVVEVKAGAEVEAEAGAVNENGNVNGDTKNTNGTEDTHRDIADRKSTEHDDDCNGDHDHDDDGGHGVEEKKKKKKQKQKQEQKDAVGHTSVVPGIFLHEYLLAGWGMPIGELFDLEGLSRLCEQHRRWEFFVASSPLNMPGGVSSPPNCVAIF